LQAERLAAIGQTMTALAHESRNALQRIQASVEMLQIDMDGSTQTLSQLKQIENAADDLRHLLDEVRTFAAPVTLDRSNSSLSSIWKNAWQDVLAVSGNRRPELIEHVEGTIPLLCLDASKLRQVFRNIFENAIESGRQPMRVEVIVKVHDSSSGKFQNGDAERSLYQGANSKSEKAMFSPSPRDQSNHSQARRPSSGAVAPCVDVTIRDNGAGFSVDPPTQIFEPFFTTKSTGTGLGLAIARRIVEAHDGTISARNSPRGGAEILLRIPLLQNGITHHP
jgi:signal transduction histidine kinase